MGGYLLGYSPSHHIPCLKNGYDGRVFALCLRRKAFFMSAFQRWRGIGQIGGGIVGLIVLTAAPRLDNIDII